MSVKKERKDWFAECRENDCLIEEIVEEAVKLSNGNYLELPLSVREKVASDNYDIFLFDNVDEDDFYKEYVDAFLSAQGFSFEKLQTDSDGYNRINVGISCSISFVDLMDSVFEKKSAIVDWNRFLREYNPFAPLNGLANSNYVEDYVNNDCKEFFAQNKLLLHVVDGSFTVQISGRNGTNMSEDRDTDISEDDISETLKKIRNMPDDENEWTDEEYDAFENECSEIYKKIEGFTEGLEASVLSFVEDVASNVASAMQKDYDYKQSEECISDYINECEDEQEQKEKITSGLLSLVESRYYHREFSSIMNDLVDYIEEKKQTAVLVEESTRV